MARRQGVKIDLEEDEYEALCQVAETDIRPVPMQARLFVRDALRARGLLPTPPEEAR